MKQSFVVIKNGIPSHTAHMAFNNVIKSGDTDEHGCSYIEIPEGVSDERILGEYVLNPATKKLVHLGECPGAFYKRDVTLMSWVYDIETAKMQLSKIISDACRLTITSGFASSAVGEEVFYPYNQIDQQNLNNAMIVSMFESDPEWLTPFWCKSPSGNWLHLNHTAAQIQQVGKDGKRHVTACQLKNARLQAQIQAATTEEELNSIAW